MFSVTLVPPEKHKVSAWAGGTTRELAIFPPDSSYAGRNFAVRVSSATVELETSVFTALPGYTRYIIPLEGEMRLEHTGHPGVFLPPFAVHCFEGDWQTTSYGTCTDFNLMLRHGWEGELSAISYGEKAFCAPSQRLWLYCLKPLRLVLADAEKQQAATLSAGDLLCLGSCTEAVAITVLAADGEQGVAAVVAKAWRCK